MSVFRLLLRNVEDLLVEGGIDIATRHCGCGKAGSDHVCQRHPLSKRLPDARLQTAGMARRLGVREVEWRVGLPVAPSRLGRGKLESFVARSGIGPPLLAS